MKTLNHFKLYAWVAFAALLITSCDNTQVTPELADTSSQEGFMSITGNEDAMASEGQSKLTQTVLHLQFDGGMSEDEASAKFDQAVSDYLSTYNIKTEGVSTEWFFEVSTYTGTQTNNNTDGQVRAGVLFNSDIGEIHPQNIDLNNPGNDREKGQWDYYFIKVSILNSAVSWLELESADIRLQGTDGWFVKNFNVELYPSIQSVPAIGTSSITSYPDVWLDNTTSEGWDTYATGAIGIGRLNF